MNNFIIISILIFVCFLIMAHVKNIEKEMEFQNEINRLMTDRIDAISKQLDVIAEMVDLESKRLDIYKNDNDDNDDWWKKS